MQRPAESILRKMLEASPLRLSPVEEPPVQSSQPRCSNAPPSTSSSISSLISSSISSSVPRELSDALRSQVIASSWQQFRSPSRARAARQTRRRRTPYETDSPLLCALLGLEPAAASTASRAAAPCDESTTSDGGPYNRLRDAARALSADQMGHNGPSASVSPRPRHLPRRLLSTCDREETERLLRHFLACIDFPLEVQKENRTDGFNKTYVVVRAKWVMHRLMDFAVQLRGFATIPQQCQTAFVQAAAAGCILLHCSYLYDTATGSLNLEHDVSLVISDLRRIFPAVSSTLWTECTQMCHSLKQLLNGLVAVTHGEQATGITVFALLQAILITSPELVLSGDRTLAAVADIQSFYMVLLRRQCEATYSYEYASTLQPVLLMYMGIVKRLSSRILEALIKNGETLCN